jgi:hypothetical protein
VAKQSEAQKAYGRRRTQQARNDNARQLVRESEWEQGDGEGGTRTLTSRRWKVEADVPRWQVVQPAAPVRVSVPRRIKGGYPAPPGWETAVILPDLQAGYWLTNDGDLVPFHDRRAVDIAVSLVELLRPDRVVCLGDWLDLPAFASKKWPQEPAFARTTQAALDYVHQLLAKLAKLAGRVDYLEGNHDARMRLYLRDNARAAYGVKTVGADWPAMSVPALLRLDDLGVRYRAGYPANAVYLNENLTCIHGTKTGGGGKAVNAVLAQEQVSVIQGHTPTIQSAYRTRNDRDKPKFTGAWTFGCLCRIDGAVPDGAGVDDSTGRPVKHWTNWQQGLGVVHYEPRGKRFSVETVPIFEGHAVYRGEVFLSPNGVEDG